MGLFKKEKQTLKVEDSSKEARALRVELERVAKELESIKTMLNKALIKAAVTRFNPFHDVGGDQSFTIALLNQENTGLLITSHYGRDMNRVYAKPVTGGKSDYSLSKEEENTLSKAMK